MTQREPDVSYDLAALEHEAGARRRSAGLHDSETRKRALLQRELDAEVMRPLIPGNPSTDLAALPRLAGPRPVRGKQR
jgi:hypothetical protein